ncbi:hypothetical protein NECAME_14253 [Necator americanus]|uniref:Protein phosphatase methylesterase 1 n=1 Tax=Necator americanus TaxID=51031 RepID=W2SNT1_NECAM|nr:hypothetical protein NECAME_14253 [Necator americanus]ETN71334.1 hypothetical protein NECAME_14253 [Necator americanus]
MSSTLRQVLSKGLPPPGSSSSQRGQGRSRDVTPLAWEEFFDENRVVDIDGDRFSGNSGPVFYFLHGGGYSGLTWSCLALELCSRIGCRLLAPDLRGHGQTQTQDEVDLSTERQVKDIINIFKTIFCENGDEEPPLVCVVGHSSLLIQIVCYFLTTSLVLKKVYRQFDFWSHSSCRLPQKSLETQILVNRLVESCVASLRKGLFMDYSSASQTTFLRGRPATFESEEKAIGWCLQSGATRNRKAARISMPSQIKRMKDGKYTWRVDLMATEPFWVGWFKGLSAKFLSCSPPKLLVLAGVDRLDKDLTIAQMQGKFQNTILPKVGHAVHEDSPDRLADELVRFAIRHRFAEAIPGSTPLASRPVMGMGMMI